LMSSHCLLPTDLITVLSSQLLVGGARRESQHTEIELVTLYKKYLNRIKIQLTCS
jgi:hypothetical protein